MVLAAILETKDARRGESRGPPATVPEQHRWISQSKAEHSWNSVVDHTTAEHRKAAQICQAQDDMPHEAEQGSACSDQIPEERAESVTQAMTK